MSLTLTNTSSRCQVFVLAHETYCDALGDCECDVQPGRDARRTATSLTLASGVTSPELDDAVLAIPELARAVRRGEVTVTRLPSEPEPEPAAVTESSPVAGASPEGSPTSDVSLTQTQTQPKKKRGSR